MLHNQHVVDVCVAGADGAGAAPSAAVAHASTSVSNAKKQTTITALKLYAGFVRLPFACMWPKGEQILAKRLLSLGGYRFGGGMNFGGYKFTGGGKFLEVRNFGGV